MMDGNFWSLFVAALVPMIVGFLWYSPKLFGNVWMNSAKLSEEDLKGGNMPLILGLSYIFSFLLAFLLNYLVHHDIQLAGIIFQDPELGIAVDTELGVLITDFITGIKARYTTFGHGMVHGMFISVLLVFPLLAINAMFERKGFKYIMVNWGYWALTIMLMAGVLSKWF